MTLPALLRNPPRAITPVSVPLDQRDSSMLPWNQLFRFVAIWTLAIWLGGFTFYAAAVILVAASLYNMDTRGKLDQANKQAQPEHQR